ncbi:hypothetical protein RHA1_ro09061 (plasmid) [Rhodococcus jostii RHA1]|uniref:Uncharacterized protein n=1 Tax=Rhodococcus jostii (strain RHA1) TaxID=101510 RepID=Q0RX81_RHOJR|nr:hypothetical protein RHA1_ro09061 [Rhodococcus jostii RHA1]
MECCAYGPSSNASLRGLAPPKAGLPCPNILSAWDLRERFTKDASGSVGALGALGALDALATLESFTLQIEQGGAFRIDTLVSARSRRWS